MSKCSEPPQGEIEARTAPLGRRDSQTVVRGGGRASPPTIDGVQIFELGNVITRSGWMMEVFRTDWPGHDITTRQVNYVVLNSLGVTDWHCHMTQTDRLIGISGIIKLCLWDGRKASPTSGKTDIIRFGSVRPLMVTIPSGIWHGLRNESGEAAAYLNVADQVYVHENPDNWRASAGDLPNIL